MLEVLPGRVRLAVDDRPRRRKPDITTRTAVARPFLTLIVAIVALIGAPTGATAATPPGTSPPPTTPADPDAPSDPEPTTDPASGTVAPTDDEPVPATDDEPVPSTTVPADSEPVRDVFEGLSEEQVNRLRSTVVACGADADRVCRWILDATGNATLADLGQWFVDVPLLIALVLLIAYLVNRFVRTGIHRYLRRLNRRSIAQAVDDPSKSARSTLRMATASAILASAASVAIYITAGLVLLGELGVSLGPLLAGAGIVGIAIAFGAQNVIRDVLGGLFVLIEDQYGVGDVIDAGRAVGRVEDFTLRVTKVRDLEGTLWFVPNGLIEDVGNKSQVWSRAILDIDVAYGADHDEAGEVIKGAADRVWREQRPNALVVEEPELWGVERLGDSAVTIRLAVKCAPADQWAVARAIRGEVKRDLDAAGIEIPFPQQSLWVRSLAEMGSPDSS